MTVFQKTWAIVLNYIHYVKNHQILVDPKTRVYGLIYTLTGWFLLGCTMVFFDPPNNPLPHSLSFLISFATGTLFLYLIAKVGQVPLKVTFMTDKDQKTHFGIKARKALLWIRGIIAILSYMGLVYAKDALGIVDDSAIFSADALVYALLMWLLLKENRSFLDWVGILIATAGVSLPFILNTQVAGPLMSIYGGLVGLFSSIFMSIIFFMNAVLVRHEPASRIAFYQYVSGFFIALVLCLFTLPALIEALPNITLLSLRYAIYSGLLFSIALICFFRAFLYTEIILIAVAGYGLDPISVFLNGVFENTPTTFINWLTIGLIALGTFLLYIEEHRHAQKRRNMKITQPIYESTLAEQFEENDQQLQKGEINVQTFLAKRKIFNDLLFKISEEMIDTDVQKIELEKGLVYFSLFDSKLRLECDEQVYSTPLEILNLGSYWKKELPFIFDISTHFKTLLDFNAQIGWLSLNLAKKFPKMTLLACEAVGDHYSHLIRNIKNNQCSNVHPFNLRLSDHTGHENLFLLPEERILTPQKNALIYSELTKIEVELSTLDAFLESMQIFSLDLLVGSSTGNELELIRGSEKTLKRLQPLVILELFEDYCLEYDSSIEEIIDRMKKKGYLSFQLKKSPSSTKVHLNEKKEPHSHYFFFHHQKHQELLKKYSERLHKSDA